MRINTNLQSQLLTRQSKLIQSRLSTEQKKLASALRINQSSDDAAGLAISEKLRGQLSGINGSLNSQQNSLSNLQIADSSLGQTNDLLGRAKELATQRAGTNDSTATAAIDQELGQIYEQLNSFQENTEFEGQSAFDGNASVNVATDIEGSFEELSIDELSVVGTGSSTGIESATDLTDIGKIDDAINRVTSVRGQIGSYANRIESNIRNTENTEISLRDAESKIRDLDYAQSISNVTRDEILQNSSLALQVQANQAPSIITQLLG